MELWRTPGPPVKAGLCASGHPGPHPHGLYLQEWPLHSFSGQLVPALISDLSLFFCSVNLYREMMSASIN